MNTRFAALLLVLAAMGCKTLEPIRQNSPFAEKPVLVKVYRPGPQPIAVDPAPLDEPTFYALPGKTFLVEVTAPWPTSLEVTLDGTLLEQTDSEPRMQELEAQGLGYVRLVEVKQSGTTFDWMLAVSPPPATRAGSGFELQLRDVSINPNATGTSKTSDPLKLRIGSTLYSTVATTRIKPTDAFCGNIPRDQVGPCSPNSDAPKGKVRPNVEIRGFISQIKLASDVTETTRIPEEDAFTIVLDWGWQPDPLAVAAGIQPLNTLEAVSTAVTPFNITAFGTDASLRGDENSHAAQLDGTGRAWGGAGALAIHVEVNGWLDHGGGRKEGRPTPADWIRLPNNPDTGWPFDTSHPPSFPPGQTLKVGDYVRLVGALWEDHPLQRGFPPAECWKDGFTSGRGWMEMHPVDFMALLPAPSHPDALETLSICGDASISRVIRPHDPRPSETSTIGFEEHIDGDFTVLRSVGMAGSSTGSRTITTLEDGIRVDVTTRSKTLSYGAKFKASYRVFWQ